jgi:hypothetical protein
MTQDTSGKWSKAGEKFHCRAGSKSGLDSFGDPDDSGMARNVIGVNGIVLRLRNTVFFGERIELYAAALGGH